jgi:D-glycero-D-manno-heptose 1,7-bisphosphate phosphatase
VIGLAPIWVDPTASAMPGSSDAPAVFLDRDGVLNEVRGDGTTALSPRTLDDVRIVPVAVDAVARLRAAGYRLVVVSNQPDIARGAMTRSTAVAITRLVVDALELDGAYLCPHQGSDGCRCRKPLPGMVEAAIERFGLHRDRSWLVGDRWVDIAAGGSAGLSTVLVEKPYSWDASGGVSAHDRVAPTERASDVAHAAELIVAAPR